ncbi:MAG: hypothetical protein PHR84_05265 [Candidatus Omnitrophica bacterium]|nr:hypothetical protein [Candidatus Omnitrophota bacterium]MDD5660346.1 hypothetical protein [Candidatus Omnitrophota bacterium]
MQDSKTPILFPIEIINRELDYKLFLACMCLKKSNRVFVGQHDAIFRLTKYLRGGVYIGKNIFREEWPFSNIERYMAIKKNGFVLVHLDEEGAVYYGMDEGWKSCLSRRLDPRVLSKDDFICTWGNYQNAYYRSLTPACSEHIRTVGYPKFDLYKPPFRDYFQPKADELKSKYGDFILVNTNFVYANYGLGPTKIFTSYFGYLINDLTARKQYLKRWSLENKIFADFIDLINILSLEFPNTNIIVRPHPCEDSRMYRTIFDGVRNIKVVHEGSVVPWILASKTLIHNGCTTAIEAYFLGANIISYKPVSDPQYGHVLSNQVGRECVKQEEVLLAVKEFLTQKESKTKVLSKDWRGLFLNELIDNFNTDNGLKNFIELVLEADRLSGRHYMSSSLLIHALDEFTYQATQGVKKLVRPFLKTKQDEYRFLNNPNMYVPFQSADIQARLKLIENILKLKISVNYHGSELFSLSLR